MSQEISGNKPEEDIMSVAGDQISETKGLRRDLDKTLQELKSATGHGQRSPDTGTRCSRERNLAITKIQEAIMWLGMDLKALNEENANVAPSPYPESYNPASPVIAPTADNLKL